MNLGPLAFEARITTLRPRSRRVEWYYNGFFSLWVRKRADVKCTFRYNVSFFNDSVVVSVLARQAGDHGSIHGQVAFLVPKQADVKYNFCFYD